MGASGSDISGTRSSCRTPARLQRLISRPVMQLLGCKIHHRRPFDRMQSADSSGKAVRFRAGCPHAIKFPIRVRSVHSVAGASGYAPTHSPAMGVRCPCPTCRIRNLPSDQAQTCCRFRKKRMEQRNSLVLTIDGDIIAAIFATALKPDLLR